MLLKKDGDGLLAAHVGLDRIRDGGRGRRRGRVEPELDIVIGDDRHGGQW